MEQKKTSGEELMDFLADFNKRYQKEHPAGDKEKAYRPATPPAMTPCYWGYPCNNCGQCH
ncbi:MAG: hypothetical protein II164_07225 [Firmicutes bacterium]|jgi:hypothetical protein|nr:hypothetical protein [Bacillota bacterium]MBQ2041741.1 hypothetical protein [Bacillota bacterium]MBQ5415306.1 hypothetical protein [Bacillota bacterium]MBQ6671582.1 hypothetical protein [Bacillota bacterium]